MEKGQRFGARRRHTESKLAPAFANDVLHEHVEEVGGASLSVTKRRIASGDTIVTFAPTRQIRPTTPSSGDTR